MTDNIIKFPGFVWAEDRKRGFFRCGKPYRTMKAMVADMSMAERKATLRWYPRRYSWATDYRLDHLHRILHCSVYEPDAEWLREGGSAA